MNLKCLLGKNCLHPFGVSLVILRHVYLSPKLLDLSMPHAESELSLSRMDFRKLYDFNYAMPLVNRAYNKLIIIYEIYDKCQALIIYLARFRWTSR